MHFLKLILTSSMNYEKFNAQERRSPLFENKDQCVPRLILKTCLCYTESSSEALLVTIVGMHTPSKLDLSEHRFSTQCQFGKEHPSGRNEHFENVKNWYSHYSVPVHDRFKIDEENMSVTLSVISHIGSRTKHGGYAVLEVRGCSSAKYPSNTINIKPTLEHRYP